MLNRKILRYLENTHLNVIFPINIYLKDIVMDINNVLDIFENVLDIFLYYFLLKSYNY